MKILAVGAFDPASVVLSHRDIMRRAGHDFRVAVARAYTPRQTQADWVKHQLFQRHAGHVILNEYKVSEKLEGLQEFADDADVVIASLGIGYGDGDWASQPNGYMDPQRELTQLQNYLQLLPSRKPKEAVFFHGSLSTWTHRNDYHQWCNARGLPMAASTIDYAVELNAAYLPPLVTPPTGQIAKLRGEHDPLIVAHTPTDKYACSTEDFMRISKRVPFLPRLGIGISHREVWELKVSSHASFDHLRGSFSVNTLEAASVGLAPLFALSPQYRDFLTLSGIGIPPVHDYFTLHNKEHLHMVLYVLESDYKLTRTLQGAARQWWENNFNETALRVRLTQFYEYVGNQ